MNFPVQVHVRIFLVTHIELHCGTFAITFPKMRTDVIIIWIEPAFAAINRRTQNPPALTHVKTLFYDQGHALPGVVHYAPVEPD